MYTRHSVAGSVLLALLLAACGDDPAPAGADTLTPDTAPEPDTLTPDTAPEVTPDTTPAPRCGDGFVDPDEVCDDGPDNGAWNKCGFGCNGPGIRCGNGFIEAEHEVCDDGEKNGQYGRCATDCQGLAPGCGDGVVTSPFESCDDGPNNGEPGFCAIDCNPTPGCGDGTRVDPEVCDEGALNGQYGHCAFDCSGPGPACGDGSRDKGEACDDGELNGAYGSCAAGCKAMGPYCGDGLVEAGREQCDDGELNGQEGQCNPTCTGLTSPFIAQPADLVKRLRPAEECRDDDLLQKYLHYRLRLRGDGTAAYPGFVVIGEGDGMSMPASRREPGTNCAGHWAFTDCPRDDFPDAKGVYNWGDGTIWQGEYLALLALEYAMFTRLGLPTEETLSDLRLAMHAVDRVDERAETFFPGVAPARDGLFVRDDVPEDFMFDDQGGYRWKRADGVSGYECVSADIICEEPDITDGSFTSQDQTIALIYGLALVDELVPAGLMVDGVELARDAREKVHRLVWFLRKNGWKVKDPNGNSPPDAWGGNAIGFSNAMAKVANAVVGDEHGVSDYRNFASRTIGEAAWVALQAGWEATHGYNRSHGLKLAAANGVWDASKMASRSMSDGKDQFAVLWAVLQGKALEAPFSNWRTEALLRTAPCTGPCNGPGCPEARPGWMGESRTINPEQRIGSRHWQGEFNGLDYMVIFASYFLYRDGLFLPKVPERAPLCQGYVGLDAILASGASEGQVYDPRTPCAAAMDLSREYCGRRFGSWLDDATQGKVQIYAGGGRWTCVAGGVCTIAKGDDENTNGDDLILGTSGADELSGDSGNDCIVGFGGDDVLEGNQGYDMIDGGEGHDKLFGEGSGLVVDGEGDVLWGGNGNDEIEGGPGKDELHGGAGDDKIEGGNGDDYLMGEGGSDWLWGELGDDMLRAGDGDDWLDGGWGDDGLWGGAGRDRLDGDLGDDSLYGDLGPDFLRGGEGKDSLVSGDDWDTNQLDKDRMCGGAGDDVIWGGWDGDECLGGGWLLGGTDSINGCDDETADSGDCDKGAWESW